MTSSIPSLPWAALDHHLKLRPDYFSLWQHIADGAVEFSMRETAQILLVESSVYAGRGAYGSALHHARQALELAAQSGDRLLAADAGSAIAGLHTFMGNYADGKSAALQALAHDDSQIGAVGAMIAIGLIGLNTNDFETADHWFENALNLSRRLNYRQGVGRVLHNQVLLYRERGDFEHYLSAGAAATQLTGLTAGFAIARMQIGLLTGKRAAAREALAVYERLGPQGARFDGTVDCFRGMLAADEEDFATAEQSLQRALAVAHAMGNASLLHFTHCAAGRLRLLQGDAAGASGWARTAVANAQRIQSKTREAEARVELARAQFLLGDLETAEAELLAALDIAVPLGAMYWAALAAFLLAALHFQQARPTAESIWLEASRRIQRGGYSFIYERERELAFPLLAHFAQHGTAGAREAADLALAELAKIPPLPLHITGLGRFEVYQGRRRIADRDWRQRKAGELFRFLLLQPNHAAAREVLCDVLWPEQSPEGAQRLFHLATSTLRRILEPDLPHRFPSRYLDVEGEQVALRLPSGSTLDVEEFEHGLTRWLAAHGESLSASQLRQAAPPQAYEAEAELKHLLALYADDLFPPDHYTEWALAPRERLAELCLRGLLALAQLQLMLDQPHAALDACRRALAREPWREDVVLTGMQAHLRLNDRAAALRLYSRLEQALREEFKLAPRPDLYALAASIMVA